MQSSVEHFLGSKGSVCLIAAFTIILFLITNLPWQLEDHDQAKQAFTSFQMVEEGHWFYQQTPHEHVATKPPLVGWISAGFFALTRSWDVAWRLPSFLAAIGLLFLLWRAATSAYGPIAGLIASSAFGLNLLSPRLATLVRTDMPLALVIFLLGLLIWRKIRQGEPWETSDRLTLLAWVTAAMLIKGPIVYAFLLPGIALFQWRYGRVVTVRRQDTAARRPYQSAWSGWWPWLASLGIFLAWVIGGIFFEADFFDEIVMREFLGRFSASMHRPQPLLFYLPHLLHKFFPWSLLMVAMAIADLRSSALAVALWAARRLSPKYRNAVLRGARHLQAKSKPRKTLGQMSPETFWLICWISGGLIVMSLVPSKRVDRIFPIIPPLCLLLAAQVSGRVGALRRPDPAIAGRCPYLAVVLALAILFTGGYTYSKIISGYHDHQDALAVFCRGVRGEAAKHGWRYEVARTRDEAMLLYLQKTHFVEVEDAIAEWNQGNLDAIVALANNAPALIHELHGAALSGLKSHERKMEPERAYVLIARSKAN
jgi:4-amino-4-deoxy-L-arabinose transferase-like glycosyltransferase